MPAKFIKIPIPFIAQALDYHDFRHIDNFIKANTGIELDYIEMGNPNGYHAVFFHKGVKPSRKVDTLIRDLKKLEEQIPWDKPEKIWEREVKKIHNKMIQLMEKTLPVVDWTDLLDR